MFKLSEFDIKINLENGSFEIYDEISYCKYVCRDFNQNGLLSSLKRGLNNMLKERKELGYDRKF